MEIVVAVKPVPEAETRLRVAADGRRLDEEAVKFVLGGYDESAVEQALLLKEAIPNSTVRAVSYGVPGRTEEVLRAALALGCDRATWVEAAPGVEADPASVARAVAMGVRKGPAELVICGKQAGDDEAGMVASALGEELGWPDLGYAVDVRWDASRKVVTLQRASGASQASMPASLARCRVTTLREASHRTSTA